MAGAASTASATPLAGMSTTSCEPSEVAREDRGPVERAAPVEIQPELRRLAGEHRLGASGGDRDAREVARGVHHAGEAERGQQEGEREPERQRA